MGQAGATLVPGRIRGITNRVTLNNDNTNSADARDGLVAGLIAYTLWGVLPVYFKLVESVPAIEVLLHRIIWAVPFGALIILVRSQWGEVRRALTHPQMLFWLTVAAGFIAINWYIYIVAVQTDRIFQASLGYYINPLIFVLAGMFFFAEKLTRWQTVAVVLAAIGVLILTISGGGFPWIALGVGTSFAIYGVIRKRVVIGAMPGLFVETIVLALPALVWMSLLIGTGEAMTGTTGPGLLALLMLGGPITVVPLLMFAIAARRLPLTTIGFMQFLAPTMQFLTGIYYGEALTTPRLVCFAFIWGAVIVFSADAIMNKKRARARRL